MNKLKSKIFLIIAPIVILVLVGSYFGYSYYRSKILNSKNAIKPLTNTELMQKYSMVIAEYRKANEDPTYFINWRWNKRMIEAEVKSMDKDTRNLVLNVKRPVGSILGNSVLRTHFSCPVEKTILLIDKGAKRTQEIEVKKAGFEITDVFKRGQTFYTYCLSEDCINVGNVCILRGK